jgi:hypothetical protein
MHRLTSSFDKDECLVTRSILDPEGEVKITRYVPILDRRGLCSLTIESKARHEKRPTENLDVLKED